LPQRGDVVVFRYPPDPAVNYIKRVVGMPGDTVQVKADQLIINGEPVPLIESGRYSDGCYVNMRLAEEQLGAKRHKVMHCVTPQGLLVSPLPGCDRDIERNYVCEEQAGAGGAPGAEAYDSGDSPVFEIPAGHYLMIGDNRDNSADGRYWGFVDENLLVGKATRIWFNLDLQRSGGPKWSRIGARIE
jgi:signal peptidase I